MSHNFSNLHPHSLLQPPRFDVATTSIHLFFLRVYNFTFNLHIEIITANNTFCRLQLNNNFPYQYSLFKLPSEVNVNLSLWVCVCVSGRCNGCVTANSALHQHMFQIMVILVVVVGFPKNFLSKEIVYFNVCRKLLAVACCCRCCMLR